MRIGIIGAMDEEIRLLKEKLENIQAWTRADVAFYKGTVGNHEVILVKSGIGKVQAALVTTLLIHEFKVQAVINTGSAGGIGENLRVGEVVIGEQLAYFDVDVTGFGYKMGQLPALPEQFSANRLLLSAMQKTGENSTEKVRTGLIVSGDCFVHSSVKIKEILQYFPAALACEMEGAAVAQVCHQFGIGFLVVRSISDTADHEATQSFDEFIVHAGKKSAEMVLGFLENLT